MDRQSKCNSPFYEKLREYEEKGRLSKRVIGDATSFYESCKKSFAKAGKEFATQEPVFSEYLDMLKRQESSPFPFEPYHKRVESPHDYYQFGLDFFGPLVDKERSSLQGEENLEKIQAYLERGENVIFYANHQIEADPQVFSEMTREKFPQIAKEIIFVAGERVLFDPVAAPFSMGRNLLCIYSKRHIDNEPEKKQEKQAHNTNTMRVMGELLREGGKCIYVAPSGGRDRPGPDGQIIISPFDPQSVEMFYFIARKAKTPTHFFPLSLSTYALLPPPANVRKELGEERVTNFTPIHIAVGDEIAMEKIPNLPSQDKHLRRKIRAEYIYNCVCQNYRDVN